MSLVLVVLLVGLPLRSVPGWLPVHTVDRSKVRLTMDFAFGGYEGRPGWDEYHRLMTTIDDVGRDHGCGRAFAEADRPSLSKYGTLVAFMLLPYWTDGCISTVNEGLEVSETSLYEQLVKVELSKAPNINLYDLPYENLVVNKGVEHLQLMGVRYYLAVSPETKAQADANPDLVRRARSGPWNVYEVKQSALVTPLAFEPVVIEGKYASGQQWSQVGVNFFADATNGDDRCLSRREAPTGGRACSVGEREPTANVFNLPAIGSSVNVDVPRTAVARGAGEQDPDERRSHLLRRRPHRLTGAREDLVLPQLEGVGRARALACHAELHGRRAHRAARHARLRLDAGRPVRLRAHARRHRRRRGARLARPPACR